MYRIQGVEKWWGGVAEVVVVAAAVVVGGAGDVGVGVVQVRFFEFAVHSSRAVLE